MEPQYINLRTTVQPGNENTVSDRSRLTGVVKTVTVAFPPGASALVDVAVKVKNEQIVPTSGFLALDDTTQTFPVNVPVDLGDIISAVIRNADSVNPHTITVVVGVFPPGA